MLDQFEDVEAGLKDMEHRKEALVIKNLYKTYPSGK